MGAKGLGFVERASRLETQEGFLCYSLETEFFFFSGKLKLLLLGAFNRLDEAYLHYGG